MKRLMSIVVLCSIALSAFAEPKTYYVDSKFDDYTGHDGSSWEKAFETIQQAIDKAAASGDKIFVASGVYEGGKTFSSWGKARLSIVNKSIWIEGAGADKTIVKGQHGSDPDGMGTDTNDFVRCVQIYGDPSKGTVLKGMTFCNGSSARTQDDPLGLAEGTGKYQVQATYSGGVFVNSLNREVYVVDCIVSNCLVAATAGVVKGATFVRSRIIDNHMSGPANSPTLISDCNLLHCLVAHNSAWKNGDGLTAGGKVVNCTFVDNSMTTQIGSSTSAWFYNSITYGKSTTVSATQRDCNVIGSAEYQDPVMSLWTDDIRIRRNSDCAEVGDAAHLADLTIIPALPEGIDRYVDLYGNPVPTEGRICPGAVQEVADEVCGSLRMDGADSLNFFHIDGGCEHYAQSYHYPSSYPTQYVHTLSNPSPSNYTFRAYTDKAAGRYQNIYAGAKGELLLTPPPTVGVSLKIGAVQKATKTVYVDPTADVELSDGSEGKPYRTIKDAIEASTGTARLLILAKPGTYAEGDMTANRKDMGAYKCRVFAPSGMEVRIVGLEGPERTIIKGAPDPVTKGLGDNAVRVAIGQDLQIVDCTLTGGYSDTSTGAFAGNDFAGRTGGMLSPQTTCVLKHCIITNNYAERHAAVDWSLLDRCLIRDNHALGPNAYDVIRACYAVSCVIGPNEVGPTTGSSGYIYSGGENNMRAINCTMIVDKDANPWNGGKIWLKNMVVVGGNKILDVTVTPCNNFLWGTVETPADQAGMTVANPMMVDDAGRLSLFARSPVRSGAVIQQSDGNDWYYTSTDFYGNRWHFNADGTYAAGAIQDTVDSGVFVDEGFGGVATSDGKAGYIPYAEGEDVTVGCVAGSSRPVSGYVLNGVTNSFVATSVTISSEAAKTGVAFVPLYSNRWYVDCTNGSDTAGFGYNPVCAFKTIARALTNETLRTGDTVALMPGVYEEGKMWQDATHVIPSRAVVRNGITLEAEGTAAETIIRGLASDDEDAPTSETYKPYTAGLGTNAIRCVWTAAGAVVRGLTLENGHTRGFQNDGAGNHGDADYNGGNAFGAGRFERCVLRNGKAFRGGGAKSANCYDCIFTGNESLYGGGATSDSSMYGCLSYGNTCRIDVNRHGFFFYVACENCTIADADGGPASLKYVLKNCLLLGKGGWAIGANPGPTNFINCAAVSGVYNATYCQALAQGTGCILTNAANLQVDADYRPIVGANVAIDAGDAAISPNIGDTDLSGGQRVYNGALDIGALEGDWRATYAKDLAGSRATVKAASSNVVESLTKTVILNPEAKLEATLAGSKDGRETDYGVTAKITGNGQLIAKLNGEVLGKPLQGPCEVMELKFTNALAENELSFEYVPGADDTGSAEILKMRRYVGTLLIVR